MNRDRRKLTFYFKADRRVDFRDLTKENFRIFKSRIWMSMVPKDGELCLGYIF
jgi:cell fate regulator YaaT (PSP1 superfamily)